MVLPAFVGGLPGGPELAIILVLAVLLFGADRIPRLARSLGESTREFRRGREELEDELAGIEGGESTNDGANPGGDEE